MRAQVNAEQRGVGATYINREVFAKQLVNEDFPSLYQLYLIEEEHLRPSGPYLLIKAIEVILLKTAQPNVIEVQVGHMPIFP